MSKSTETGKDAGESGGSAVGPSHSITSLGTGVSYAGPSRIVGSQAKKQEIVTRQGTQKMKFVPTLPARRKKPDAEVKQEEILPTTPKLTERGRGRGRGLGRGRGGPPVPRPEMQMVASGPFAMGPALAGLSKKRTPRSNFTPVLPMGPGSASLGEGLSHTGVPGPSRERVNGKAGTIEHEDDDVEVYSDPDEGVQIVDMDAVKTMDWMAPESLRRERNDEKKPKKQAEPVKKGKEKAKDGLERGVQMKNLANALNLSESEEEEEMEDLIEDFAMDNLNMEDEDSLTRQEKLYFFQFPQPFPSFSIAGEGDVTDIDAMVDDGSKVSIDDPKGKKVTFAQDVKPPAPNGPRDNHEEGIGARGTSQEGVAAYFVDEKKLDGVIGQLEVHRSGIIKMRLNNGILMDVTAATQPSFLQHAVFLDPIAKKLHVLGEVNRRFVVSPDVDKLLEDMNRAEAEEQLKAENIENHVT